MSAELEYERIRNTYYYSVTSDEGEGQDDIFGFEFQFPPFPFPEHNESQRAIFTLLGMAVGDQSLGQQLGATSFLSLEVAGVGLKGQNYNSTNPLPAGGGHALRNTNRFMVPNIMEGLDIVGVTTVRGAGGAVSDTASVPVQRMSGNLDLNTPLSVLCGNPSGTTAMFKVFGDDGALIGANGNLNTIVRFSIELIPN